MAIAFDSYNRYTDWTTTDNNVSGSHTMGGGSNKIVIVASTMISTTISSLTYGGNAMTQIGTAVLSNIRVYLHYYLNPPGGSNTVSLTTSGNNQKAFVVASYTGVDQNSPIDVSNTGTSTSTASANLTTTVEDTWLVAGGSFTSSVSSFTGVTPRPSLSINTSNYGDSNGAVASGSQTINLSGSGNGAIVSAALTPGADTSTSYFFMST